MIRPRGGASFMTRARGAPTTRFERGEVLHALHLDEFSICVAPFGHYGGFGGLPATTQNNVRAQKLSLFPKDTRREPKSDILDFSPKSENNVETVFFFF